MAPHPQGFFVKDCGSLRCGFFGFASGQTEWRRGFRCFRCGWWWRKRQAFTVASVVARSVGRVPSIPFGRDSHALTRQGTQVVEACVVRHRQRVSRGSVWPRTRWAFSAKHEARYGVAFSVLQAAKRNPRLARARGLLRPALFVTASEFHGVPFGPAPARLFRQSLRLIMVWLFRFCKRPNGMEVGFSLLSLWWVVTEEAGQTESGTRKGT